MASRQEPGLTERKRALRSELRARRRALDPTWRTDAGRSAAWHALGSLPWCEHRRVALFWPLADEIDTLPLLHALHWLGAQPLLPRMQGRGRPLMFHRWTPELELVQGPFQVLEPAAHLPIQMPDIVMAPLLAFDARGRRLGYGAGFYDMTFTAISGAGGRPIRAGYCFAAQEVELVPVDDTDIALDLVITESGCRAFADKEA